MKKLFLLSLAVIISIAAYADSKQTAVLNHNGEYTTFYTENALDNAISSAVDNDIITLSPGYFKLSSPIRQNLTIIGAGIEGDENKTSQIYSVSLFRPNNAPDDLFLNYHLENLIINEKLNVDKNINLTVTKCKIHTLLGEPLVANFTNCELDELGVINGSEWNGKNTNIVNSVIKKVVYYNPGERNFSCINCVFHAYQNFSFGVFENCIFLDGISLSRDCSATNCKHIGRYLDFFKYHSPDNECAPLDAQVFTEDGFYELTPEYAQKWLGKDGTQVGIYGGPAPFTTVPSNPYISKFDVAPKTTPEGKLSIDVEISAAAK